MRIVFMGTPAFAATILKELAAQHEVVAVYTRADAVRGRGNTLVPSPVKEEALELGLPVFTPKTLRSTEEQQALAQLQPDAITVAAYGMILPPEVLSIPRYGCLNAHASLLPRWRGAAPIERAILAGDREAGVCAMNMEEGLDTGDYCVCRSLEIGRHNAQTLTEELALLGAQALLSGLAQLEAGRVFWTKQDETAVTYANKLEKGELNLQASDSVVLADRKVRASSDAHPAKCVIANKELTVLEAQPAGEGAPAVEAGTVLFQAKRLFIGCADGALELLRVKPQGKKEMDARSFAAGVQNIKSGTITWRSVVG